MQDFWFGVLLFLSLIYMQFEYLGFAITFWLYSVIKKMNFLKNFGAPSSTSASIGGGAPKPLAAKNNYFTSLKTQYPKPNQEMKDPRQNKNRRMLAKGRKEEARLKIFNQTNSLSTLTLRASVRSKLFSFGVQRPWE